MADAQRLMTDQLGKTLDVPKESLVLDAGCGEGATALQLARDYGLRVRGIDVLEFNVKRAQEKARKGNLDIKFAVANYNKIPFQDDTFDAVYAMETVSHSPDYRMTLREFQRVLKPGGVLVLFEYTIPPDDQLTPIDRRNWQRIADGSSMASLHSFRHGTMSKLLADAGFGHVSERDITARTMPMLKRFYQLAIMPYQLVRLFGVQARYANTAAGATMYKAARDRDAWRYLILRAVRL